MKLFSVVPTFRISPTATTVNEGQRIQLTCTAEGRPRPSDVLWLKDGQTLNPTTSRSIRTVRSSSSEITSTLEIRVSAVFDTLISIYAPLTTNHIKHTNSYFGYF